MGSLCRIPLRAEVILKCLKCSVNGTPHDVAPAQKRNVVCQQRDSLGGAWRLAVLTPLEHCGYTLTPADAHGFQAELYVTALHFVKQGG